MTEEEFENFESSRLCPDGKILWYGQKFTAEEFHKIMLAEKEKKDRTERDLKDVFEWGKQFEALKVFPRRLTYPQFQNKDGGVIDDYVLSDVIIFDKKDGQLDLSVLYIDMEE